MTGSRPGSERDNPFLTLPRTGPFVEFFLQRAKAVAGCVLCDAPIAPGSLRVSIVLKLPTVRTTGNRPRQTERYYLHGGCLSAMLEGRPLRTGRDCWDCGMSPTAPGINALHDARCYTTSRFATGPLCPSCTRKRRWRQCAGCEVYFPPPMVSPVVSIIEDRSDAEDIELQMELCDWCAERCGMKTKKQAVEEERAYEEVRARIASGRVFSR